MEELQRARAGDVETTAQVQVTLQQTLFASSSLEMRMGKTEEQQAQARVTIKEAKQASQRALLQAQQLQANKNERHNR